MIDTPASPIAPSALRPVLAPMGEARALPGEAYTDPEVLAWERRHFFASSWVCVGGAASLGQPGDQLAVRVGGEGVLLVRDPGEQLRGFFNVCRHRGHELLPCGDTASSRTIRCPYHRWVYGLDGRLRGAPRFHDLPASDPVREGLIPAPVTEWHGWVFINASGSAPHFRQHVGNLEDLVAPYRPERLIARATHHYEVAANWKLIVENYHECYHCTSLHPELCRVTPTTSGESFDPIGLWVGGSMDLMAHAETMSLSGRSHGVPLPGLEGPRLRQVHYLGLFPNLLISLHPDYVMTHRIEPMAPDRSLIECQWLFPPEATARADFDPAYAVDFWDLTNRQDWGACESVQRGVASRGYRPGPLAGDEDNVHQFLTIVAGGYLEGAPAEPVPPARTRTPDPQEARSIGRSERR